MKPNQISRLEKLEDLARRWKVDEKVHEAFRIDNNKTRSEMWTQKEGIKTGDWIEFKTPREALEWVGAQLTEGVQCQCYVDDIRDLMIDEDREFFDLLFPQAPGYMVMFEFRKEQDIIAEAVRLWKHALSGAKHNAWWERQEARAEALRQELERESNGGDGLGTYDRSGGFRR